jgi:flagellar basal-body rod protein FlgB
MFEKLGIFSMAQAMAKHGAARQAVIAENVANADTPGYRARDIDSFAETYRTDPSGALRTTRAGHFIADEAQGYAPDPQEVYRPGAQSPNGNSVSLEQEMFAAAEAKQEHDQALAIYRSALTVLRTAVSSKG